MPRNFREQRGVFIARGMNVRMTDHGRAWKGAGSFSTGRASLLRLARAVRGGQDIAERRRHRGSGERRRREDGKRVGSPATQRNVVRGPAGIVTERSDGAIPADAARRGAVDLADDAGPGVVPRRAQRGGARWADDGGLVCIPPTRAARRWGPGDTLRFQRLERPARVRSNRWKTYGLPCPDVGNRQDATRDVMQTILSLNWPGSGE